MRVQPRLLRPALLLTALGGLAVTGCATYCLIWYQPAELSFRILDVALTCWLYCATKLFPLGLLAVTSGLFLILAALLIYRGSYKLGGALALGWGLLTFPAGLPGLYASYLAWQLERQKWRSTTAS
ncbi:MAG: hypothetical protein ACE5MB_09500 [Anaerolineae bacterium]